MTPSRTKTLETRTHFKAHSGRWQRDIVIQGIIMKWQYKWYTGSTKGIWGLSTSNAILKQDSPPPCHLGIGCSFFIYKNGNKHLIEHSKEGCSPEHSCVQQCGFPPPWTHSAPSPWSCPHRQCAFPRELRQGKWCYRLML